jgi:C4-dicarboxylate-specific signal transduction histidine kinase
MLCRTHFSGEGEGRRPIRGNGVVLDITARKVAEAEAERQRTELAHLMRVAVLGGLSGGIAHELKQPLAAILSNAQAAQAMLAKENLDREELGNVLEDIVQEDSRAGEVIHRLRSLLRKEKLQSVPVSMNELIMSTLRIIHSELMNRKVKVETDLAEGLPAVSGDLVELQQVLLNVLMNAMEAMGSTPPALRTLSIATRESKHGGVEVSIRDRGHGMSPEQLARVHQPFFTTKKSGLGLGLSICSTILESHRGRLTLSSAGDGGIVATISLPKIAQLAAAS